MRAMVVLMMALCSHCAMAADAESRLFVVDWRELGPALAPDAQPEKRAWALGYIGGVLDEINCRLDSSVQPPVLLKRSQAELETLAKIAYLIYLEQRQEGTLDFLKPGMIGATVFVRAAMIRLWKCELQRMP